MARHKSRVTHTRRRRNSTRSRKQSGGWLFGLFGNKPAESENIAAPAPAPAPAEPKKSFFSGWFGAAPTPAPAAPAPAAAAPAAAPAAPAAAPAAPEEEQKGGRRKKSRKHHRRHRK